MTSVIFSGAFENNVLEHCERLASLGFKVCTVSAAGLDNALKERSVPHDDFSFADASRLLLTGDQSNKIALIVVDFGPVGSLSLPKQIEVQSILLMGLATGGSIPVAVGAAGLAEVCQQARHGGQLVLTKANQLRLVENAYKALSARDALAATSFAKKATEEVKSSAAATGNSGPSPVLVIGGGGREHAIASKLAESPHVSHVYVAPGNGGTAMEPDMTNVPIKESQQEELLAFCRQHGVSLVAVGPEAPLVEGMVDFMTANGIPCFGPTKAAAQLEASKAYSKDFMQKYGLPTARYRTFTDFETARGYVRDEVTYPVVVKASGLAAGKGVILPETTEEAVEALRGMMLDQSFGAAGSEVVVEERMDGPELSLLAFADGDTAICMPGAQDHKRALDNDLGLNTGGMGAYAPAPVLTPALRKKACEIVQRTITAMAEGEGIKYNGVLYAGFMLTAEGPKLLEFNCRFGDPETQVLLPLLRSDLYEIMMKCSPPIPASAGSATGSATSSATSSAGATGCTGGGGGSGRFPPLSDADVQFAQNQYAATVVAASGGYPQAYRKGIPIDVAKLRQATVAGGGMVKIYHAGTKAEPSAAPTTSTTPASPSGPSSADVALSTSGGRVLAVTGIGSTIREALTRSYRALKYGVDFDGLHYRRDIGWRVTQGPLKIGVLGSTRGTDLQAILDAVEARTLQKVQIEVVVSDRAKAGILDRARRYNIPAYHISASATPLAESAESDDSALPRRRKSREEHDGEVTRLLQAYSVDLVLLVGYMRILGPSFIETWRNRCLNVHPSLLPDFAGGMDLEVHRAVLAANRTETGCTVHFVTEEVDGGPIAVQLKCPVDAARDTPEAVKARVQGLEGEAFVQAITMYRDGKIGAGSTGPIVLDVNDDEDRSGKDRNGGNRGGGITYKEAGVDIDAGNDLVQKIKPYCKATNRDGCEGTVGGFGGVFDLARAGYGYGCGAKLAAMGSTSGGSGSTTSGSGRPSPEDVLLVGGTDGVGTKLRVAMEVGWHGGVGIDLVAMCVNDLIVQGAEPLFFLDYYATGHLDVAAAAEVVRSIAIGCHQSGCALIGGETAEMPGMYEGEDYDLAGFAVGAVRRSGLLPVDPASIPPPVGPTTSPNGRLYAGVVKPGDVLLGLPSSGIHSNGFSLVRKIIERGQLHYTDPVPFAFDIQAARAFVTADGGGGGEGGSSGSELAMGEFPQAASGADKASKATTLGQALLTPTKIYIKPLLPLLNRRLLKALAHITGGGLTENLPRVLPDGISAHIDLPIQQGPSSSTNSASAQIAASAVATTGGKGSVLRPWTLPPMFRWLQSEGCLANSEMLKTFNCGIGMVLVVAEEDVGEVLSVLGEETTLGLGGPYGGVAVLGRLEERGTGEGPVVYHGELV